MWYSESPVFRRKSRKIKHLNHKFLWLFIKCSQILRPQLFLGDIGLYANELSVQLRRDTGEVRWATTGKKQREQSVRQGKEMLKIGEKAVNEP